jgi:hypothetical protein
MLQTLKLESHRQHYGPITLLFALSKVNKLKMEH